MAKKEKAKKPVKKCKGCSESKAKGTVQTLQGEVGNCGNWFFEVRGGIYYSCRWCVTQGPTAIPYKECIALPE